MIYKNWVPESKGKWYFYGSLKGGVTKTTSNKILGLIKQIWDKEKGHNLK